MLLSELQHLLHTKILSNPVRLITLRNEHWHHRLMKVIPIQIVITFSESIKITLENVRKEAALKSVTGQ